MIAIQKDGRSLKLFQGVSLPWEVEDDMLDFDYLGQAFSYEFKIPRKGNEWAFNFAGSPDNPINGMTVYDGFEIVKDGALFWAVSLTLKSAFTETYIIEATSIASPVSTIKDKLISELISQSITIYTSGDYDYDNVIAPFNTLNSNMVFPYLQFYDEEKFEGTMNFGFPSFCIPCFKIKYLLQLIAANNNFTFVDRYAENGDDYDRLILINNRLLQNATVQNTINVQDFVPKIKFFDLLQNLAFWTCSKITIDGDQLILQNIERGNEYSTGVDLSEIIDESMVESKNLTKNGIQIEFDTSADSLLKTTVPDLTGNFLGEFSRRQLLANYLGAAENDYGFAIRENAYYKFYRDEVDDAVKLKKYSDPFQTYRSGTENVEIKISLLPTQFDFYQYRKLPLSLTITDNGVGKVRLSGFTSGFDLPTSTEDVYFVEGNNGNREYSDVYFEVAYVDPGNTYIDLDVDYEEDVSVSKIIYRKENLFHFPLIGDKVHYPEIGQFNEDFSGRIAIWHGLQYNQDSSAQYPMAGPSPYNTLIEKIGTISLAGNTIDGIVNTRYAYMAKFFRSSRIFKISMGDNSGAMSESSFVNLWKQKIGVFSGIKFRLRSISTQIGDSGPQDTEIEGYRL